MLSFFLMAVAAPTDLTLLDRAAEIFAGAPRGTPGGPLAPIDRRLRLAACGSSPEFTWRSDAHDAIVIRCPDNNGWRIFVTVAAAPAAVQATAVKAEPVIRRGDPVTMEAGRDGFAVSADGIAMNDAAPGARLQIKVEGAKAPVQAIAVEAGKATLPGW
ncbi:flagella basal body P-ring formation protein FlgA [Sphingomonas tabacisoli]|uniref:Flagella basal body P-ring formation protein FlgA n=1 Tax=Sphingomonas tabacisoli TaxID=2249466 RepID=A0ABW4HY95_9SPHN